jgi:hypothetical protein
VRALGSTSSTEEGVCSLWPQNPLLSVGFSLGVKPGKREGNHELIGPDNVEKTTKSRKHQRMVCVIRVFVKFVLFKPSAGSQKACGDLTKLEPRGISIPSRSWKPPHPQRTWSCRSDRSPQWS